MRTILLALGCVIMSLAGARPCAAQWRKVADSGASDSVLHDRMPPGWHITTGPAAILFDAANQALGRFAVEAEIHLFPGESNEGFGVFLGGSALDSPAGSWTAFLIRKDGSASIERRVNNVVTTLVPSTKSSAIKPHTGGEGTALNQIRVLVQGDSAVFSANGQRVAVISTREIPLEGTFGFRVGKDLNLHVTNLDLVTRLAPFPVRR